MYMRVYQGLIIIIIFFFIFAYQNVSSKKEGFLSALFIAVSTEPRMVPGTY